MWGRFRVDCGSIWGRFWINFGSIWGRLGVDLGSVWDQFGIDLESVRSRFGVDLVNLGELLKYLHNLLSGKVISSSASALTDDLVGSHVRLTCKRSASDMLARAM